MLTQPAQLHHYVGNAPGGRAGNAKVSVAALLLMNRLAHRPAGGRCR